MINIKKVLAFSFTAVVFFAILKPGIFQNNKPAETGIDFDYFYIDCTIFNKDKKIIYQSPGYYCDFSRDGSVLHSRHADGLLHFDDRTDRNLWSSAEYIHHDMKFSEDQKSFLIITSEVLKYDSKRVRGDCFSRRNLSNKTEANWCLSEHIAELKKMGFKFFPTILDKKHVFHLKNVDYEISHANSIYEIPENPSAKINSAFKKGNYLVNLFFPSYALLIIDRDMKKILWSKNLDHFKYGIDFISMQNHDNQVTEDGRILTFVNSHYNYANSVVNTGPKPYYLYFSDQKTDLYSSIIKWDPFSNAIDWIYKENPPTAFYSQLKGTVTKLKNGNFFVADITDHKDRVFIVEAHGKKVWEFKLPEELRKQFGSIRKVAPLYDSSFLKNRGLID